MGFALVSEKGTGISPRCTCDLDAAFLRSERPPYEALRPRIRIVDLFAGCGGLTIGVAEAALQLGLGIDVRLAIDFDSDAVAVYQSNFPGADVRHEHVEDLFDGKCGTKMTTAERRIRRQVGQVDILVGGPPCQGHSDLNTRTRRDDPRNALYARMARAAEVLKPAIVLIENVPTVKHDVDMVVEVTSQALISASFIVSEEVVDISRLGAPQKRRRHVLLASRNGKVDVAAILSSLEQRCPIHRNRSVRWAIGDLQKKKSDGFYDSASVANDQNTARIKWLFEHKAYDLPNEMRPKCHRSDHSYVSMYGRLKWNEPAQTVTTGFGSMGQGRYVHPSRRRTITPHEAARLQSLPDFLDFEVVDTRGALARLIGNAVPPVLAQTILVEVLSSLGLCPSREFPEVESPRKQVKRASANTQVHRDRSRTRPDVPVPSSVEARKRMEATRQHNTAAEMALRKEVDALRLTYEANAAIPGTRSRADLLFGKLGVVVFVDGCFWHLCPIHKTYPKANAGWWREKLEANKRRDEETDRKLHEKGWLVLRLWEHEDPKRSAQDIALIVRTRLGKRHPMR